MTPGERTLQSLCWLSDAELNSVVNLLFTVEKYCMNVARRGCIHAADSKNVVTKAHGVDNSPCIQDDEQVCCIVCYTSSCVTQF